MDIKRVAVFFAVFISWSAYSTMPDFLSEASSPNPDRGATSLAPNEVIDTFSGSLSLVHTDLIIPGQGGLDLRIQRSYSSNNVYARPNNQPNRYNRLVRTNPYGLGWSLHFGRIRALQSDPNQFCSQPRPDDRNNLDNPVLEMPDGSQRQLFCNTRPSAFSTNAAFITKDHWAINLMRSSIGQFQGYQAISPAGIKYTMNFKLLGGQFTDQPLQAVWYTTKIEDRNGNRLDISYDTNSDLESPIYKYITSPDGRRVEFFYANTTSPGRVTLTSIRHKNRTIRYNFKNFTPDYTVIGDIQYRQLERVRLPGGSSTGSWNYSYHNKAVGQPGDNNLKTVTYPLGAKTTYDYKYVCILFNNCSTTGQYVSLVVDSKLNNGRSITQGTWNFDYSVSSDEAFNVVKITGPNSIEEYRHHKPPVRIRLNSSSFLGRDLELWKAGLLQTKTIRSISNALLQTETYEYAKRELSSEFYERAPFTYAGVFARDAKTYQHYLIKKTINRDGSNYVTQYRDFNDNINPHRIIEQGQASKTTNRTYYPRRNGQNIVSLVANEQVGSGANRQVTRTFDSKGNTRSENLYGVVTGYTYDANGNVTQRKDARGSTTKFSNFKLGVPTTVRYPQSVTITRNVDDFGNVTSEKDGRGHITQYRYDELNRSTRITPPLGAVTVINWTRSKRTVTRGRYQQTVTFDGLGRTRCTTTDGIHVGIVYDAVGNKLLETYPGSSCRSSIRTLFSYDGLNRAVQTTHADNSTQIISYLSGNRHSLKDERGNTFVSHHRSFGDPDRQELMRVTGPVSLDHRLERNILGQVTQVTRNNVSRRYDYGLSVFLQTETHPETGNTVFGRDAVGNTISQKVGASPVTRYAYDRLNRLIVIDYPSGTPDVRREYDKSSNLTRVNSGIADLTYAYDKNNNLTNETQVIAGKTYYLNNRYDDLDFLTVTTNPDNSVIEYAPNALGWPTKAAPFVQSVTYNDSGQPLVITHQNGRKTTHSYHRRLWPNVTDVDGRVSKRTRTYDTAGNLTTLTDNLRGRNNRSMTYDGLNRLTSAIGPWGASNVSYGAADDIIAKRMGADSDLRYNYNTRRQITSVSGAQGLSGLATLTYDAHGNVVRKSNKTSGWAYAFDGAFNLTVVRDHTNNVLRQFDYSGLRQRVRTIKDGETRLHITNQRGQLINEFVINGDKPSITNVYLGNRLVTELELRGNADPDRITGPGFGGGFTGTTVMRTFRLSKAVESVVYCVKGYAVNNNNEVRVEVNGQVVGFLNTGVSGTRTCLTMPSSLLQVGINTVTFNQSVSDGVWGIGRVDVQVRHVFNAGTLVPTMMLLLDDTLVSGQ